MAIYIGNNTLSAAKLGTTNISSIWLGDAKLWPTIVYYKFQAEYSDGTTYDVECDGSGTLGTNQTKPSGYEYSAMTEAIIGDCVSGISSYSFERFINLSSVTMSSSVTQLGNSCFSRCVNLSSITIPNSITSIGDNCFNQCTSLSNITLPTGITYLGGSCFYKCSSLSSIIIPSNVRDIGASCFASCSSLLSVTIPSSVTYLGSACFGSCSSLSSVTIPSSVTRIDSNAFAYCRSLQSITVEATTPPALGSNAFNNTNNCPIYVPCQSVDTYKAASGWSTYASRIQPIQGTCPKTLQWVTFNYMDDITSDMEIYGVRGTAIVLASTFTIGDDVINFDLSRNDVNINIDFGNCYSDTVSKTDNVELIFSDLGCSDYYQLNYDVLAGGTFELYIYA